MRRLTWLQFQLAKLKQLLGLKLSEKERFFLMLKRQGYHPRVSLFLNDNFRGTEEELYAE